MGERWPPVWRGCVGLDQEEVHKILARGAVVEVNNRIGIVLSHDGSHDRGETYTVLIGTQKHKYVCTLNGWAGLLETPEDFERVFGGPFDK